MEQPPDAMLDKKTLPLTYAQLFATERGKVVLADLRRKFSHARPRFPEGSESVVRAARIDGQCDVIREIEAAINQGANIR